MGGCRRGSGVWGSRGEQGMQGRSGLGGLGRLRGCRRGSGGLGASGGSGGEREHRGLRWGPGSHLDDEPGAEVLGQVVHGAVHQVVRPPKVALHRDSVPAPTAHRCGDGTERKGLSRGSGGERRESSMVGWGARVGGWGWVEGGCGALMWDVGLQIGNWGRVEGAVGLSCAMWGCKSGAELG